VTSEVNAPVAVVIDRLLTHPERYMTNTGTYADGYIDGLIDVMTELGMFHPASNYVALRKQIRKAKLSTPRWST
jgi:hypothetical protein